MKQRENITKKEKGGAEPEITISPPDLIPTGSALLNLALSDHVYGGFRKGSIVNIIGDRSSGKSFLLWDIFAAVIRDNRFDDYRLLYDEPERALLFKLKKLFGKKIKRVEFDDGSKDAPLKASITIQDFYHNIMGIIDDGKPFVYGLDSFDALTSEEELERKDVGKGGYKTEKAIALSEMLRQVLSRIESTGSLLIIVSQTRDNIGVAFGKKKTRSGGRALGFYALHELWLAIKSHIKRKNREVGVDVKAKLEKNKITGKLREVEFPIIFDYGLDDTESMINWLVSEKYWSKKGRIVKNEEFGDMPTADLISTIESSNDNIFLMKEVVFKKWMEIEDSIKTVGRKPKYD